MPHLCCCFLSDRITGGQHHAWFLGIKPRVLFMLNKHSTNWAISQPPFCFLFEGPVFQTGQTTCLVEDLQTTLVNATVQFLSSFFFSFCIIWMTVCLLWWEIKYSRKEAGSVEVGGTLFLVFSPRSAIYQRGSFNCPVFRNMRKSTFWQLRWANVWERWVGRSRLALWLRLKDCQFLGLGPKNSPTSNPMIDCTKLLLLHLR